MYTYIYLCVHQLDNIFYFLFYNRKIFPTCIIGFSKKFVGIAPFLTIVYLFQMLIFKILLVYIQIWDNSNIVSIYSSKRSGVYYTSNDLEMRLMIIFRHILKLSKWMYFRPWRWPTTHYMYVCIYIHKCIPVIIYFHQLDFV